MVAPDGEKTVNSNRNTPRHTRLENWPDESNLMPDIDEGFAWDSPRADAFNSAFNPFNDIHFIKKHNIDEKEGTYWHRSFRHGLINNHFAAGLDALITADVVAHVRSTVAKAVSGETYLKLAKLPKLHEHVYLIPKIKLPVSNYNSKYN